MTVPKTITEDIRSIMPHAGITIRAGIGWGRPCVEGTGINTDVIASRCLGGESVRELAADYGITIGAIRCAVAFEFGRLWQKARWEDRDRAIGLAEYLATAAYTAPPTEEE